MARKFFFPLGDLISYFDWIWHPEKYGSLAKRMAKIDEINHLRFGIETYVLAREFIYKASDSTRIKADQLYVFLDELHSSLKGDDYETRAYQNLTETKFGEKIRKRYVPYLNLIKEKYDFDFNFQDKSLDAGFENNKERLHAICKDYLSEFCYYFSDESLRITINNWNRPADLLYFFVVVRYAIKYQFPITFKYRKLMFPTSTSRNILPKLITLQDNHLGLIGYDKMDGTTKSFLISRISDLQTDLQHGYYNRPAAEDRPAPFNYAEYIANNPSAKYLKVDKRYEITLSKNNLDLLKHSKFNAIPIQIVSEAQDTAQIIITTHDEWGLFDMLFNYETYAKLTGPQDALDRFTKKLHILSNYYRKDAPGPKKKTKKR